jgi:hypothetical protein
MPVLESTYCVPTFEALGCISIVVVKQQNTDLVSGCSQINFMLCDSSDGVEGDVLVFPDMVKYR